MGDCRARPPRWEEALAGDAAAQAGKTATGFLTLMIVIVGLVVVFGAVLVGFTMAGGHVGALIHLSEFVTIGGAALGALIMMSPKKVLIDLVHGAIQCVKGTPYNKRAYEDLFKLMYDLLRLARSHGLLALESHLSQPQESAIFSRYPRLAHNHRVVEFIAASLSPVLDGTTKPERLPALLEGQIKLIEEEHHGPLSVLSKTADALPGFGIVAAVMGMVITMGAIDGPVEEIGHKVGAALVGTFLGILLSYGLFAPLAVRMEFLGAAEVAYFRTIASVIQGFGSGSAPRVTLEQASWGMEHGVRLSREELEELFNEADRSPV